MTSNVSLRAVALAAALAACPSVHAQSTLPEVVVTGNPLRSPEIAAPSSVLRGDELVLRRGSSLGETLSAQPGVSSTYFGPNADRPVIRGLDGERVRMLSNAGASLDASTLSFDHAVPIDPLIVERIEVLRGPAALLYGGSAVGGVVNTLDNRIPQAPIDRPRGAVELRLGGAASERAGAALAETGNGRFGLHVDAYGRKTTDLRVPRFIPLEDGAPLAPADRVRNSASRTHGGAAGGALFFDDGRLGLSIDRHDSRYGTPAEEGIEIDMQREHAGVALDWKNVRARADGTRYRHQELEADGAVGTVFESRGHELRLEVDHARIGPLRGTVGAQLEDVDFSALGEEAFVPTTRTRRQAVFVLEELAWSGGTTSAGLRIERAQVRSDGDAADADEPRFGAPAERRFTLRSASIGHVAPLAPGWSATGTLSVSERAPTSFELFANGVHVATAAYERGDPALRQERGSHVDIALQWKSGDDHLRVGAFHTRFSRFISLEATGTTVDVTNDDGDVESFDEYAFRAVRARLAGVEVEGRRRLLRQPWTLDLGGKLDFTRATNLSTGEPLPRVAPLRLLLALDAAQGPWGARVELDHAARQSRVPATDRETPGATRVNAMLTRRFAAAGTQGLWFVKLDNVGDTLAYSASTIGSVRGLSPLPGRSLKTGVRLSF